MSMDQDWSPDEVEAPLEDEVEAPDENTEEEEELPEALKTRLAAETEKIRQQYETDFNKHKANHSRRLGKARQLLAEQFGLDVDDEGNPVYRDPELLRQAALRLGAGGQPKQAEVEEPEEMPDPYSEPQEYQRWMEARTTKKVEAAVAPLLERIDTLMGYVGQQAATPALENARGYLEELGQGALADTPEFRQAFQQAIQNVPLAERSNPMAVEAAVGVALPYARRQLQEQGWQPPQQRQQAPGNNGAALAAAQRAGLQQTGASRGSAAAAGDFTAEEIRAAQMLTEARGKRITPADIRRLRDNNPDNPYRAKAG